MYITLMYFLLNMAHLIFAKKIFFNVRKTIEMCPKILNYILQQQSYLVECGRV